MVRIIKICERCKKEISNNKKYCSYKCLGKSKQNKVNLICKRCGSIYNKKKSKITEFCSVSCKSKKFKINENYFNKITNEKIQTIGQILVIGYIKNYRTLILQSDYNTLLSVLKKLKSNHTITKSYRNLYRVNIFSKKLVDDLFDFISNNIQYSELPDLDFDILLEGIKDTHCYKDNVFILNSPKISKEISYRLNMRIKEMYYKDQSIGRMCREFKVY